MTNYDAILFDLGNTLVSYYQRDQFPIILRESLSGVLMAAGVSSHQVDLDDLLQAALRLNREREDHMVWPLSERLHTLMKEYRPAQALPMETMVEAFLQPIFQCAHLDKDATTILDELRKRSIRTAIVSNTPWGSPAEPWRRELARHGLLERCDAVVFCVEVGWRKPHKAPFHRALELIECDAARSAFVGDNPRWDVIGARESGLTPILITQDIPPDPHCQVIKELRHLIEVL